MDFDEPFSHVASFETVRVFLALAALPSFLNGELKEEAYVAQPERCAAKGEEDKVYRLKRLYMA